jgi:hypothetical protein
MTRQLQREAFLAKWSKVDWSKQDCELADEMGLSGERIRQIRQQLGAPKPAHPHRRRTTRQALEWAKNNLDKLEGLSWAELQRKYGLTNYWRRSPLHSFLRPFLRNGNDARKHPWDSMNFSLPNGDLARIWRLPYSQVASHRSDNQRGRSRWRLKLGSVCLRFRGREQLQAYHQAVEAEERNAARYFAQA